MRTLLIIQFAILLSAVSAFADTSLIVQKFILTTVEKAERIEIQHYKNGTEDYVDVIHYKKGLRAEKLGAPHISSADLALRMSNAPGTPDLNLSNSVTNLFLKAAEQARDTPMDNIAAADMPESNTIPKRKDEYIATVTVDVDHIEKAADFISDVLSK